MGGQDRRHDGLGPEDDWHADPTSQSTGSIDDAIQARYVRERILSVRSTNPSSGVSITVSPSDYYGSGNGSTSFTRRYRHDTSVSLTAPATNGCNPFLRWVVSGTPRTGRTISVTMDGNKTAVAEYRSTVVGTMVDLGSGCPGSNGRTPLHTVSHSNGSCGPQQGTRTYYRLSRAKATALGVLQFGLSNNLWNGLPLPLNLGFLGAPRCHLRHDLVVGAPFRTTSNGDVILQVTWPVDASSRGVPFHTTFMVIDMGANGLNVVLSNARSVSQGG